MMIRNFLFYAFFLLLLLSSISCRKNLPDTARDVARVGKTYISSEEFERNYEFGFANLKQGPNPKETYLNHMINERLLSLEGYARNLERSGEVQTSREKLLSELFIEALIWQEVRSKIKIPEADIRREISEQAVRFKFRYYLASSARQARTIHEQMKNNGFSSVDPLGSVSDFPGVSKVFSSEYVNKQDIPEAVFAAIRDLPIGEISDPVELSGQFAIIQMLDIRRQALLDGDFKAKAASVEQQLFYRELDKEIGRYLDQLLTPKNIVTNGPVFGMLARAVLEWQEKIPQVSLTEAVQMATENLPALQTLAAGSGQTLTTWKNGRLTVEEFLPLFNTSYLKNELRTRKDFLQALNEAIQFSLRDYFLEKEARHQKLALPEHLQKELAAWSDKWVYQSLRSQIVKNINTSTDILAAYQSAHSNRYTDVDSLVEPLVRRDYLQAQTGRRIDSLLTTLREKYEVEIYHQVLDTLKVDQSAKTRGITLQVFKSGTNRQAWPVTDPALGVHDDKP